MAISKPFAYNPPFGNGFNFEVNSTKTQSNGKIMAVGDFTTFLGESQNRAIRLNSDGTKDTSFNIGSGFNNDIFSVAIQSDGKILAGGIFTTFTGSTQNKLIRLNSDGSKDSSFNIGVGFTLGNVYSVEIQSDEKILVGGDWQRFSGSGSQRSFIRLNSDGSKDTTFNIGIGFFGGGVWSTAIQSDGKILAGGDYTSFSAVTQRSLIRLNSNGSKDSTFVSGFGTEYTSIEAIAIQSDGKILVGGQFNLYSGATQNYLIRLNSNGSKDTSFNIGSGFDGIVYSIAIQSDGKVLAGGFFSTFTGSTQNGLIRLNSDGSKDSTFDIGSGFNNDVLSIEIQSDGKILVGGLFSVFNGISQSGFIRLNSDGSPDIVPISGTTQYGDIVVGNIETDYSANYGGVKWWGGPNEELGYVIGSARPAGQPVPVGVTGGPAYVGFWRSKFLTDNSFLSLANYIGAKNGQPPFATTSDALTWLNNNGYYTSYQLIAYYVGGDFTTFEGSSQNFLIGLNSNGSKNLTFNIGSGFNNNVETIEIQSDGKILVGGFFTIFTGSSQNRLIRLNSDGSKDTSFDIGSGFNNIVYTTSTQSDGKILVGGYFTTFTGSSQNYLIRLNSNGSKDTSFNIGSGFNFYVETISIQSDGKILVGGAFTTFTGSTQNKLIRLNSDGSKDSSFNIGVGFDVGVTSTSIQSDGKIIVGGLFSEFAGIPQNKLIRLNSNGSKDTTFNIGDGFGLGGVTSTVIQSNGKILVGGTYEIFTGSTQYGLIRLNSNGSKDTSFDIGTGFGVGNYVFSTSIQSDGKILVGGYFQSFAGSSQNCLIRLNSDGSKDSTFVSGFNSVSSIYSIKII